MARFAKEHPQGRFYLGGSGHAFYMVDGVKGNEDSDGARVKSAWQYLGYAPRAKPAPTPKPAAPAVDPRAVKRARTVAAIARWEAKARRAENALRKLRRSLAAQDRATTKLKG